MRIIGRAHGAAHAFPAIDDNGDTHLVWGEGLNYQTPGSIWYTRGN